MKNLFVLVGVFLLSTVIGAQELQPVFKGKIDVKNKYHLLQFAFHKGDVVVIDIETDKRKLSKITLADQEENILTKKEKFKKLSNREVTIPETGVYDFRISGRGFAKRATTISISRKNDQDGLELFNPAFVKETLYDTTEVAYKCDTVIGDLPPVFEDTTLEVFDKYIYENREIIDESFQLKGNLASGHTKHYNFKIPDPAEGEKMKSYTYTMTSTPGGAKHWSLASAGASVGGMFINPAAGYAMNHMMGMMGPQAGGEPTMFIFSQEESDADVIRKMTDSKGNIKNAVGGFLNDATGGAVGEKEDYGSQLEGIYQFTKSTNHYGQHLHLMDEGTIILANTDPHKAKNVNLNMGAIFYAPLFRTVKAEEKVINPEIKELDKLEKKVTQKRYFDLLDSSIK